jgi:hypothetical protein
VSEEKESKGTLLSEDRLSVKTFADTNHNTTRYFAEIEVNGKRITSEKYASTDLFKDFERTVESLYRKAEILQTLSTPQGCRCPGRGHA